MAIQNEMQRARRRMYVVFGVLGIGFAMAVVRTTLLQTVQSGHLSSLAREQYQGAVRLPARRGDIFDRKHNTMAMAVAVPSVFANPNAVENPAIAAKQLSKILGMDLATLRQRLQSDRYFVWLKRQVTPAVAEKVKDLRIAGVATTQESKRFYPNKELAAHVLGFTGIDLEGLEGIEKSLDDVLQGASIAVPVVHDARGKSMLERSLDPDDETRGADVTLTLDSTLQHATEKALQQVMRETKAKSAMAVVLDVMQSDVLAMASEPTFNPNTPFGEPALKRRNKVVTDVYEPGSTLKPIVVSIALQYGTVTSSSMFDCENGSWKLGSHVIRDTSPHGRLSLTEIIALSSNIGAAKVGGTLGSETLEQALRLFGFGRKSGLSFPGEGSGLLKSGVGWSGIQLANVSFGHGIAVTALQLAAAYRVLAADGRYRAPRLVMSVADKKHTQWVEHAPDVPVVSPEVARRVTAMMEAAVSSKGTGSLAAIPGYRVAGKTGTAQKLDPVTGAYSSERYMAWFAGYLPADDPKAVIVVAVDEPQDEHTGGQVAAPVFAQIATATMQQMGVLPTDLPAPEPALAAQEEVPAVAVSKTEEPPWVDDVRWVEGQMPSFMGMTAAEALDTYVEHRMDVDIEVHGSGTVVRQDPSTGTDLGRARRIRLYLSQR